MQEPFQIQTTPLAARENLVLGKKYRITVLTAQLMRFEYSESGVFENRATQTVWNRAFPPASFRVFDAGDSLEIFTDELHVIYDRRPFSPEGLYIQLRKPVTDYRSEWRYGEPFITLGGTTCTLDRADGSVTLDPGLMAQNGFSVIDDSHTLALTDDGWFAPRENDGPDFYFFGYGHAYQQCLCDFYTLTGPVPLLPRYALGNWWSRYYRYTAEEYGALMDRFQLERIPFSVSVVDMDWHYVDCPREDGNGWTGYTFDPSLFPNPASFLADLHRRGLHVTLNLHPSYGVRPYEQGYTEMCERLGQDPAQRRPVNFDIADPLFAQSYFDVLHHPLEAMGVDFWWVDWQQLNYTRQKGLTPLWLLNHLHFYDLARSGKRPFAFSRYAGTGSHRYPVGFSGDTVISWASLRFQPEFTATAANIGFGWWSHDIGGHMGGRRDEELTLRWIQFGVFSPIMRLHSTCNLFNSKEPWNYSQPYAAIMESFLRLRHRLIPYLYTANYHSASKGVPLVRPLYYEHDEPEAYLYKNEYYFGDSLLVHPVTSPLVEETQSSRTDSYLPAGEYFDVFCGIHYIGGHKLSFFRDLDSIPVLAKAGAIIPLNGEEYEGNGTENPRRLLIRIFAGADGHFALYEDDGVSQAYRQGKMALTEIRQDWAKGELTICRNDPFGLTPTDRELTVEWVGLDTDACGLPACVASGSALDIDIKADASGGLIRARVPKGTDLSDVKFTFSKPCRVKANDVRALAEERIRRAYISFTLKEKLYDIICNNPSEKALVLLLQENLSENLLLALSEVLCAE